MNKSTAIKDIPKFTFNFFFEKIALELQENQYREMLGFLESFGLYQRSLQHRAYRPSELPTKDPRAWWSFAGTQPTRPASLALSPGQRIDVYSFPSSSFASKCESGEQARRETKMEF